MNQELRDRAEKFFLHNADNSPLHFSWCGSDEIQDSIDPNLPLEDLIKGILIMSRKYFSADIDNDEVTFPDRWRSSHDIWRHVIFYNKNFTIFDVMNCLHKLNNELGGQYCSDICKRTFKLKIYPSEQRWTNQRLEHVDEYGLYYYQWKNI